LVVEEIPRLPAAQAERARPSFGVDVPAWMPGDSRRDVGQDHHGELEPLGLVNGHNADAFARLLHDLRFRRLALCLLPEPLDEAAERDTARGLVCLREL